MQAYLDDSLNEIELNQCAMFNLFNGLPGVEVHHPEAGSDFFSILTETSLPIFNNVLRVRLLEDNAKQVVDQFTECCKVKRAPAMWWSSSLTTPSDLSAILLEYGWRQMDENPVAMRTHLNLLNDHSSVQVGSEQLMIKPVEKAECYEHLARLLVEVFELPSFAIKIIVEMFSHPDFDLEKSFQHYLGFLDGKPVAAGSVFMKDHVAGIYNVCVSPTARKCGFGEVMTRHLLNVAKQSGCTSSILQSSSMALHLYEKIGFKSCGSFKIFLLEV